jgi:hypothetical protein
LSALGDPGFDAEKYITANSEGPVAVATAEDVPVEDTIEVLQKKYFEQEKTNVPNNKKNNAAWIKGKLKE